MRRTDLYLWMRSTPGGVGYAESGGEHGDEQQRGIECTHPRYFS